MDKKVWHLMSMYNGYVDKWRESDPPKSYRISFIALVSIGRNRTEYILYEDISYLGKNLNGYYILQDVFGNEKVDTDIIRIICWVIEFSFYGENLWVKENLLLDKKFKNGMKSALMITMKKSL